MDGCEGLYYEQETMAYWDGVLPANEIERMLYRIINMCESNPKLVAMGMLLDVIDNAWCLDNPQHVDALQGYVYECVGEYVKQWNADETNPEEGFIRGRVMVRADTVAFEEVWRWDSRHGIDIYDSEIDWEANI